MQHIIDVQKPSCEAFVYAYSDPELTRLAELERTDGPGHAKRVSEDQQLKDVVREILGRRQNIFAGAKEMPVRKYRTYWFRCGAFQYTYRSFSRYQHQIVLEESDETAVVLAPEVAKKTLNPILKLLSKNEWAYRVEGKDQTKIIFSTSLAGISFASLLTCLIKARFADAIKIHVGRSVRAGGLA